MRGVWKNNTNNLTASPTEPNPKTAVVVPSFTLAVFQAAPTPIFFSRNDDITFNRDTHTLHVTIDLKI